MSFLDEMADRISQDIRYANRYRQRSLNRMELLNRDRNIKIEYKIEAQEAIQKETDPAVRRKMEYRFNNGIININELVK